MSTLLFGAISSASVPADEAVVRSTTYVVSPDAPAAEMESAPDFNVVETDSNPDLGMVTRQLASHVVPTQKYAPAWASAVNDNHLANDMVNQQVSSSGTAAAREAAGTFGHGTMQVIEGIEPVADLRDGGKMTNTYFAAGKPDIQETARRDMSIAPGQDHAITAAVAGSGKTNSRTARNASAYDAFLNGDA